MSFSGTVWWQPAATTLHPTLHSEHWIKYSILLASTLGNLAKNFPSMWMIQKPSPQWFNMFLLPQSSWMHWVAHAKACVQGTYVVSSSRGIQRSWGIYLLWGETNRLVVKWTGFLVEFHHTYNDFHCLNCPRSGFELRFPLFQQFRHDTFYKLFMWQEGMASKWDFWKHPLSVTNGSR